MDAVRKLTAALLSVMLCACTASANSTGSTAGSTIAEDTVTDQKDEVAQYLLAYHHLPSCYMTKKEARKQGWSSGALNRVIPGRCIGGDYFGNYEDVLPEIKGSYYECDINTLTKKTRGDDRIIYDDDPDDIDIYFTGDHYQTFTLLYGDGKYE